MSHGQSQPNFLFIMDDQHRFDYLGCAGADFLNTPHIDRLARRGARFTHVVTNCPLCAPARIGLAAGLQPSRLGALDNQAFHPLSVPTHYQRLRNHGYQVGMVGKHDLAKPDHPRGRAGHKPVNYALGFTQPHETSGKMEAGNFDQPHCPYTHYLDRKGLFRRFRQDYASRRARGWIVGASYDSVLPEEDYHDAYIGRWAVDWLERVSDEYPWYYFASFVGPHDPFDPPMEYAARYRGAEMPEPVVDPMDNKPRWVHRRLREIQPQEIAVTRRQYSAAIELIDYYVGMMLDVLENRGLLENTYVIFTSDHGEMLGDHGMYQKQVPYEPSIRVPLIVAGPGIEGGRETDGLVELADINPTICRLAGLPEQENIDAKSFHGILFGANERHRADVISVIRNWRLIRMERYKFVEHYNDHPELYDLQEDPAELNNIAEVNPELTKKLRRRLVERMIEGRWHRL